MTTRAYADIADVLRQRLDNGLYPSGSRLPAERQLAEELGVSRPTLREALAALELTGAVHTHVGAGTFVAERDAAGGTREEAVRLRDASPSEILAVRLLVEPSVARMAAGAWDRPAFAAIARPLQRLERAAEAGSAAHPTKEDREFHAAIARAADNAVLTSLLTPLWAMMTQTLWRRLKTRGWDSEHTVRVAVEHREIHDAIRSRDGDLAAFKMEKHIRGVVDELFSDK